MKKFFMFVFVILLVLFCWGWISHVALGGMTTGRYLQKIRMDINQSVLDLRQAMTAGSEEVDRIHGRIGEDVAKVY